MPPLVFEIPVRTYSEANLREHWAIKSRRTKANKQAAYMVCLSKRVKYKIKFPVHVVLVRLASRRLDSDNLANSFKAVQDGIADALGVDDGDESKVTWEYRQEKSPRGKYAVRVEFHNE
jgi:hypothetical protein